MIGLEAMVFGLSATLAIPLAVSELPILGTTGSCRSSAWLAVRWHTAASTAHLREGRSGDIAGSRVQCDCYIAMTTHTEDDAIG